MSMTRRRLTALALALCAALPALFAADTASAEEAPAPNLTSTTRDLGNGYGQTVWWDAAGDAYELGLIFRLPAPRPLPGIAIPVVYREGPIEHGIAHGLPRAWAYRVANCESHGDPGARNRSSGAMGLYQFLPGTWATTPQGRAGRNPYDGYANAEAAAWLYARSGGQPWSCK
jgi:soluble lytic murein transglycosylase-like protein